MDDKFEGKLKELLPYIIINAIIFLLLPLFMGKSESAATYIIQIGIFPLTAIGCGIVYQYRKHRNSVFLCAVAPLFYALAALLYGMWHEWYTVLVYIAAYFLCGYLGLMLGDILPNSKKAEPPEKSARDSVRRISKKLSPRPRRVKVEEHHAEPEHFQAEDPEDDLSLDTSTTDDDIEAILQSIHNRKS